MTISVNDYLKSFPAKVDKATGNISTTQAQQIIKNEKYYTDNMTESYYYVFDFNSISNPSDTLSLIPEQDITLTQVNIFLSHYKDVSREITVSLCADNNTNKILKIGIHCEASIQVNEVLTLQLPNIFIKKGRNIIAYATINGDHSGYLTVAIYGKTAF